MVHKILGCLAEEDGNYSKARIGALLLGLVFFGFFIWLIVLTVNINNIESTSKAPTTNSTPDEASTVTTQRTNPTTPDINECDDNPCLYGGKCVNKDGGYKCVCEIGTAGENCQQKSKFRAYSDEEGCGLEGANHNWDICGEKDGKCPSTLNKTSLCQYGKAVRTLFEKTPFKTRNCNYNYYAEYTCKGEEADVIIGKWTTLRETTRNDTISCTKKNENEDKYECAYLTGFRQVRSIQWEHGIFTFTVENNGEKHNGYGGFTNDLITFSGDELDRGKIADWMIWAKADLCKDYGCEHDGKCVVVKGEPKCNCKSGYTGERCEMKDICGTSNPCQHGGTCTNQDDSDNPYKCECNIGFAGKNCQQDLCKDYKCENDGVCVIEEEKAKCYCTSDYYGDRCEKKVDKKLIKCCDQKDVKKDAPECYESLCTTSCKDKPWKNIEKELKEKCKDSIKMIKLCCKDKDETYEDNLALLSSIENDETERDKVQDNESIIRAYWDPKSCGPDGPNYNKNWCNNVTGVCPLEISTELCKHGSAYRTKNFLNKTINDCTYRFFAEYTCQGTDANEIIGKWKAIDAKESILITCEKSDVSNNDFKCTHGNDSVDIKWSINKVYYMLDEKQQPSSGAIANDVFTWSFCENTPWFVCSKNKWVFWERVE